MSNFRFVLLILAALLGSCSKSIWNAGDLAEWVKDQVVEEHNCQRDSIELEEWYRSEADGNVWHGHFLDPKSGEEKPFGINVDSVWKPSSSEN